MATYKNISVFGRTLNAENVFERRIIKTNETWIKDTGYGFGKWLNVQYCGNYSTISTPYETLRNDNIYEYSLVIIHNANQNILTLLELEQYDKILELSKQGLCKIVWGKWLCCGRKVKQLISR